VKRITNAHMASTSQIMIFTNTAAGSLRFIILSAIFTNSVPYVTNTMPIKSAKNKFAANTCTIVMVLSRKYKTIRDEIPSNHDMELFLV